MSALDVPRASTGTSYQVIATVELPVKDQAHCSKKASMEEQQAKFAIHAACRDGQCQSHRIEHAGLFYHDRLTGHSEPGRSASECLSLPSHSSAFDDVTARLTPFQANPKLSNRRDDDDRLPLHWAASYNRLPIVELLSERKDFDVDAQVNLSRPKNHRIDGNGTDGNSL